MSLRLVELQVALPRTLDASKTQQKIDQLPSVAHNLAAAAIKQTDRKKRKTVLKSEKKSNPGLGIEYNRNNELKKESKIDIHPYKGKIFDLNG
ncbi:MULTISPECIES: hypothetical protein [Bacillaceae]|uniref:hypothetical protein n=1 Tax=Bacillaceae TaxID=186817 RepID=UPI000B9B7EF9|nr:hypothetical protein [Bacillus infantis]MCK6206226.1 hypothetical protein [Bacillus infantis]MDW2876917.1 hypothetical protein [Bacillus infantis]OXT18631.1 hypothetical protein B9K06_05175 [Bacillus sp. OG2]